MDASATMEGDETREMPEGPRSLVREPLPLSRALETRREDKGENGCNHGNWIPLCSPNIMQNVKVARISLGQSRRFEVRLQLIYKVLLTPRIYFNGE